MSVYKSALLMAIWIHAFPAIVCAQFYTMNVYIYNDGDIPVSVARATDQGLAHKVKIKGWWRIEPGDKWTFSGSTMDQYLFAFLIKDAQGRKGISPYQPSRNKDGHWQSDVSYSVQDEGVIEREDYRDDLRYTFPGYILIPFSWRIGVDSYDGYRRDRDFILHITPRATDPITVYFDKPTPIPKSAPADISSVQKSSPVVPTKPVVKETFGREVKIDWIAMGIKCNSLRPKPNYVSVFDENQWCSCVTGSIINGGDLTKSEKIQIQHEGFGFFNTNARYQAIREKIFRACSVPKK